MNQNRDIIRNLPDGIVAVDLRGEVTEGTPTQRLATVIQEFIQNSNFQLVANCKHLEFIDVSGMNALLSELWKIREAGGDILFCNMSHSLRDLFINRYGLEPHIGIYRSEPEAIEVFRNNPVPQNRKIPEGRFAALNDNLNGVTVITLKGYIDETFGEVLKSTVKQSEIPRVILDCREVWSAANEVIADLVVWGRNFKRQGGGLCCASVGGILRAVIEIMYLDRVIPMYSEVAEALASFNQ